MTESVLDLAIRGRSLMPEDRERLVELLLETLVEPAAPELEEAWNREIERRIAAYKNGEVETYDLDDVLADAKRIAP
ncbi:MAG: addiction module protein [Rhodoferax sp.]|nr:addiction module protein [Rhodoferax sp.]